MYLERVRLVEGLKILSGFGSGILHEYFQLNLSMSLYF